jgi:protein TonB
VIVLLTVATDGHVTACHVHQPSGDPDADAVTCRLALERFRFQPALDQNGDPVEATFGWQQSFFWK